MDFSKVYFVKYHKMVPVVLKYGGCDESDFRIAVDSKEMSKSQGNELSTAGRRDGIK